MIYIKLLNIEIKYDIGELVKLFFFGERISFVDNKQKRGIYLLNELKDTGNSLKNTIILYLNNEKKIELSENIDDVNILPKDRKKQIKIGLKKTLYRLLSSYTKEKPPWGILTGIRPTKIIHSLEEKGYELDDIRKMLKREYLLEESKIDLIIDISRNQKKYIYPLDSERISIYVSIPFCPTRCIYCSFPSNELNKKIKSKVDIYIEKLIEEIELVFKNIKPKRIDTLYIGGGTPTTLSESQLERLIVKLQEIVGDFKELTVEAGRPDTITEGKLKKLYNIGVDRISINPQTMNDETLKNIRRAHNSNDIVSCFNMARNIGFKNINMDLIIGLPNEGEKEMLHTMNELEKLDPDSLTIHTMAIKKTSEIKENLGKYQLNDSEKIENMIGITKKYVEKLELKPYYMYRQKQILGNFENIGYSKEGKECIYNIMIMEEKETILAFGVGGVSKIYYPEEDRLERVPNIKDIYEYLERNKEMARRKIEFLK